MTYLPIRNIIQWVQAGAKGSREKRIIYFRQAYKTATFDPYKFKAVALGDGVYKVTAILMVKIKESFQRFPIEFQLKGEDYTAEVAFPNISKLTEHTFVTAMGTWCVYRVLMDTFKRKKFFELAEGAKDNG
jgi:hypothetical protein